jgi:hypothetical protein
LSPREFPGDFFRAPHFSTMRLWRLALIFILPVVFILLVIYLLVHFFPAPPVGAIENARKAISIAGRNSADVYSTKVFNEAEVLYDSAMVNWQKENDKIPYFRDFEKVAMFADLSAVKAKEAYESATARRSVLRA